MDRLENHGPLAALAGTWEGGEGLDVSYHHIDGAVGETPYRERSTFNPFGPVENGTQVLFGLDYRAAMWRGEEVDPFHTEVGYWLWDAAAGLVMRAFMVPRGTLVLAGGTAAPDANSFTLRADVGSEELGILSNPYLARAARTVHYEVTVTVSPDGSLTYEEDSVLQMSELPELLHHTDRNVLRRVDQPA